MRFCTQFHVLSAFNRSAAASAASETQLQQKQRTRCPATPRRALGTETYSAEIPLEQPSQIPGVYVSYSLQSLKSERQIKVT